MILKYSIGVIIGILLIKYIEYSEDALRMYMYTNNNTLNSLEF